MAVPASQSQPFILRIGTEFYPDRACVTSSTVSFLQLRIVEGEIKRYWSRPVHEGLAIQHWSPQSVQ